MFDRTSSASRHKLETSVRLQMAGTAPFDATVFHVHGERITDLLNDPRAFIPVRTKDGVMIVAKTQIVSIIEMKDEEEPVLEVEAEEVEPAKNPGFNPYAMLRVAADATTEEIRAAYKKRIKAVHPDTVASLGLDEDLAKAALLTTQKLNYAYKKIMRERGGECAA